MEWNVVGQIVAPNSHKGNALREKEKDRRRQKGGRALAAMRELRAQDGFARPPDEAARDAMAVGLWRYVQQVNGRLTEWAGGR